MRSPAGPPPIEGVYFLWTCAHLAAISPLTPASSECKNVGGWASECFMRKLAYGSALTVVLACASLAISPSKATTISCTTSCGSGGPYSVPWSVNVDSGITLEAAYYLWNGSTPAGPKNQSAGKVTTAVEALPGLSSATLVDKGQLTSGDNAGSDSTNVYALHFGPMKNGKSNDI